MNPEYKALSSLIQSTENLSECIKFYLKGLEKGIINTPRNDDLIIPDNCSQILNDIFSTMDFTIPIQTRSHQESFSWISLISVFAALRGNKVLVISTMLSNLSTYFLQNPYTTVTRRIYVSIDEHDPGKTSLPENIQLNTGRKFRAIYGHGIAILHGNLSAEIQHEVRYSVNMSPKIILQIRE